jgi:hypothetical protein
VFGIELKSQIKAWQSSPALQIWQLLCGAHAIAFTEIEYTKPPTKQ